MESGYDGVPHPWVYTVYNSVYNFIVGSTSLDIGSHRSESLIALEVFYEVAWNQCM